MQEKKCLQCSKVFSKPINESQRIWENRHKYCSKKCINLGKPSWNKGTKGVMKPNSGSFKKGQITYVPPERRRKGELNNKWKGGITPLNEKIRKSPEYKLWRKAVFERDNYTCIWCKDRQYAGHKVIIHADHIKPFSLYPELRFAIDNGRTLCVDCHKKTDTFGYKIRNY